MTTAKHKFKVGDKVIYTNDFGVVWLKTISALYTLNGEPRYQYEDTDTPWCSIPEGNFCRADAHDISAHERGDEAFLQGKYGFTPTPEQLGGCY
jgi:hypothetical protein